jgi:hypothetical protein
MPEILNTWHNGPIYYGNHKEQCPNGAMRLHTVTNGMWWIVNPLANQVNAR